MPFSLRFDAATEARIRRLARATGKSKSAVVREAMARYGLEEGEAPSELSALDRLGPLVGIVASGGADLSSDTHAKYRTSLLQTRRVRRPR